MDPIITVFVGALGTAAGRAAVQEVSKGLRDITGLQNAQLELLKSVDHKIDALIQGPFGAGSRALEAAMDEDRSADDRKDLP